MEGTEVLGKKIHRVALLYRRHFDGVIASQNRGYGETLTGRNFWVLEYLAKHRDRDVFQKDLETVWKIRPSTVSRMVELMEQKQLLTREAVNGDARLRRLCLTPKAEAIVAGVSRSVEEMDDRVQSDFSPDEYRVLSELLDKLASVLEKKDAKSEERNEEETC